MVFRTQKGRWRITRPLFETEQRLLRCYFGANLYYERIRIGVLPQWLPRRAVAPWGSSMLFPESHFIAGSGQLDLSRWQTRCSLVHEATHVWQRQHGDWVTLRAVPLQIRYSAGRDVYAYDTSKDDPDEFLRLFLRSNIEQQGKIVEDMIRCEQQGRDPGRWSAILHYLRTRS